MHVQTSTNSSPTPAPPVHSKVLFPSALLPLDLHNLQLAVWVLEVSLDNTLFTWQHPLCHTHRHGSRHFRNITWWKGSTAGQTETCHWEREVMYVLGSNVTRTLDLLMGLALEDFTHALWVSLPSSWAITQRQNHHWVQELSSQPEQEPFNQ